MALKSWVIVQTAQYGSSVIILGVMRSQPGIFWDQSIFDNVNDFVWTQLTHVEAEAYMVKSAK